MKSKFLNIGLILVPCGVAVTMVFALVGNAQAQNTSHGRNYDEAKVGTYTVPDPLLGKDGRKIVDVVSWNAVRRNEILTDFRDLMYGHTPDLPIKLRSTVVVTRSDAIDGLATRTVVKLQFFDDPKAPSINLMHYVPNSL